MTQLVWNAAGARLFEAGVDRAVLYVHTLPYGVAWNGIKSVNQKPSGSVTPLYNDGVPFHNLQGGTEFSGSIEAFTYPDEFETCDGTRYLDQGISLGEQMRDEFDLSYRTKIGNDQVGLEFAYKIHLVYNATATPATRKFSSTSSNVDPSLFNWDFVTVPVSYPGFRPTSHITIDSRRLTPIQLRFLEELLYGNENQSARMPTIDELLEFLTDWSALPASTLILS